MYKNRISKQANDSNVKAWDHLENYVGESVKLEDKSSTGKDRDWNQKAERKEDVAELFEEMGKEKRAEKILNCASWLKFLQCSNEPLAHPKKLADARFCKDRFCDMCNWRRSIRLTAQLFQMFNVVQERFPDHKWFFLTLTVQNVHVSGGRDIVGETDKERLEHQNELAETIDQMQNAWKMFINRFEINQIFQGYIKSLEITLNRDIDDKEWYESYHPHYHILFGCDRITAKQIEINIKNGDNEFWEQHWKECLKVDYVPVLDIRKVAPRHVKPSNLESDSKSFEVSPLLEVAKYPLKLADVFTDAQYKRTKTGKRKLVKAWRVDKLKATRRLYWLDDALRSRRLISFGGFLKEIRAELKQSDVEKEDTNLVSEGSHAETCNCPVCGAIRNIWNYRWVQESKEYWSKSTK